MNVIFISITLMPMNESLTLQKKKVLLSVIGSHIVQGHHVVFLLENN